MARSEVLAFFESVHSAAIRALAFARGGNVEVDARMRVPQLHTGDRGRAVDPALGVEVLGQQFDNGLLFHCGVHGQTLVSQWAYLGLRPFTMSKNALWIFSVTGPREPMPMVRRSSSRIGVTSAAVPVKKAS